MSALDLDGSRVAVLGLARSGHAAARASLDAGASVRVLDAADGADQRARAADLAEAQIVLGRVEPRDVADVDLVVTSPGIPWGSPWIVAALDAGIPVWSEVELAFRLGIEPRIAITGTNGKTTTTQMCVAALTAADIPAAAVGNVGTPIITAPRDRVAVAELSSFQLQAIDSFRAPVSVLLNLAQDHLDWHGSFEAYASAKGRIVANARPDDVVVVHADPLCGALVGSARMRQVPFLASSVPLGGAGVEDGWVIVPEGRVVQVSDLRSDALGFIADAVAAAAAVCALGVDPAVVGRGLAAYEPLPHRVEHVAMIHGITFINDSKATDPHATLTALAGRRNVVLIAGGRAKGLDMGELLGARDAIGAVVAIGEAAEAIRQTFLDTGITVLHAESMEDAVELALGAVQPGGEVILSPACASFDMFDGYEARGEAFRSAVKRLEGRTA